MPKISNAEDGPLNGLILAFPSPAEPEVSEVIAGKVIKPQPAKIVSSDKVFEYAGLSKQVIKEAEAVARRIRCRIRANIIDTGEDLLSIKDKLGHGNFGPWLKFYFGMSERTAQNLMRVADVFHDRPIVVDRLPAAVIYKLAAKSTPEDLRTVLHDEIRNGVLPDPKEVLARIRAASPRREQTLTDVVDVEFAPSTKSSVIILADAQASNENVATYEPLHENAPVFNEATQKFVDKMKEVFGSKFSSFRNVLLLAMNDPDGLRRALLEG